MCSRLLRRSKEWLKSSNHLYLWFKASETLVWEADIGIRYLHCNVLYNDNLSVHCLPELIYHRELSRTNNIFLLYTSYLLYMDLSCLWDEQGFELSEYCDKIVKYTTVFYCLPYVLLFQMQHIFRNDKILLYLRTHLLIYWYGIFTCFTVVQWTWILCCTKSQPDLH